jgi:hydrogenase maturation factor
MQQASQVVDELEMAIVTGHTGTYKGLHTLVGVCSAYGEVSKERLITPGGAEPQDLILCIKPIGMETVVNFALTHNRTAERLFGIERAKRMIDCFVDQSCVKEALLLAEIEGVHAMHDTTEGGLVAALNEMASASNVGFRVEFEMLPIPDETLKLQTYFKLSNKQVLAMSSTGTILVSVDPKAQDEVRAILSENGVRSKVIGSFTKKLRSVLIKEGIDSFFPKNVIDPYEKIISST